jgi:hypothetical protein
MGTKDLAPDHASRLAVNAPGYAARLAANAPGIAARLQAAPAGSATRLEDFVFRTLNAWEAQMEQIVPDVWSVRLPDGEGGIAARYLGRSTGELLITFDLARWDEGARLECLNLSSPLVRRLIDYAEGRGCVATAMLASDHPNTAYCPYLLARLSARYQCDQVLEERSWLAINRSTGSFARVHGSPFDRQDLQEGEPDGPRIESICSEERALAALVASWQEEVQARSDARQAEIELRYQAEAKQLCLVCQEPERSERLGALAERYALSVEIRLDAVLRLWRPQG